MKKTSKIFICESCGHEHIKWMGQCDSCKKWGTIIEEIVITGGAKSNSDIAMSELINKDSTLDSPISLDQIETNHNSLFSSGDSELDRVLGGGIVPGSLVLFGGQPGIGKSTLLLQISLHISSKVLYISGEESEKQIKIRANRICKKANPECYVLTEIRIETIIQHICKQKPSLIVIDSIQTLFSEFLDSPIGSISQVKACTQELIKVAKKLNIAILIVSHVTKEGSLAGPKVMEHMVDTVLQFEGDRNHLFRLLRCLKNRFGSTSELGVYEMKYFGLKAVDNPSQFFVSRNSRHLSGVSTGISLEGGRPMIIEVQALVSSAVYGTPQRSTTGFNGKRLNLLLAVLEKRAGFKLALKDVFLNITGGIIIDDPALDLAAIAAILSSNFDIATEKDDCFTAEIGLTGEIRPVSNISIRIIEASKLGYKRIFISKFCKVENTLTSDIEIIRVANIDEFTKILFL